MQSAKKNGSKATPGNNEKGGGRRLTDIGKNDRRHFVRHRLAHILHRLHALQDHRQVCHSRIRRIRLPTKEVRGPPAPPVDPEPPAAVAVCAHGAVDRQRDRARARPPGAVKGLLGLRHIVVQEKLLERDLARSAVRVEGFLVRGRRVEVEQPRAVGAAEEAELPVGVGELCAPAGGDVEGGGEVVAQDGGGKGYGGICYTAETEPGENEGRMLEAFRGLKAR